MSFQTGLDEKDFSSDVIATFASKVPLLIENENLLHVQVADLAQAAREHIVEVGDVLAFIEAWIAKPNMVSELENAVAISFLSMEELTELCPQDSIPSRVRKIIEEQSARGI